MARSNSKLGMLNIHIDENGRYHCDIRIQRRNRPRERVFSRFDDLSSAVGYRDEQRRKLGLPPAEDE